MRALPLALTFLAVPATAAAAPIPGASYGGGVPPAGFSRGPIGKALHADAHVTADGARARVRVNVIVPCNRKGVRLSQRFDATGPIGADGRVLAQARSQRYLGPGATAKRPRGIGSVNIGFDGARASGTIRLRVSYRAKGRRITCDTGDRPVELRSVNTDPGTPGAAVAGAQYFGTTTSSYRGRFTPITLRVSTAGTKVIGALFGTALACPGTTEYLANISPPMTIRSDGTFRRTERFTNRFRNATDRTTIVFTGRFTATGATGTVRVTQKTRFKTGQRWTCRSGTLSWNAVR
jgi:hypothetical protein